MKTACFRFAISLVLGAIGWGLPIAAFSEVATIQKSSGVISIQRAGGHSSLAYDGLAVNTGDIVNTEQDSSALLVFRDKSQVALRPLTSFQVKEFQFDEDQPKSDNLVVALLKGGLRTVSGLVSKRGNRNAYRLETATATIGIRGTDFTVRQCDQDCESEQAQKHLIRPSPADVIGRVAELTGSLTSVLPDGKKMALAKSYPLFEQDELHMGDTGYALLVLTDGTRILIQSGGVVKMNNYHYDQMKPDTGNMLVEMVKGTSRILTGLIGKKHPEKVHFATVTATIGVRGTAFDIVCGRRDQDPCDGELFLSMREGKTSIASGDHEIEANKGISAYVAGPGSMPELLPEAPQSVRDNPNPLPESFPIDTSVLFGTAPQDVPKGIYTSVNDGRIVLTQGDREIEIGKGESGFAPANGSAPILLSVPPSFLDQDEFLGNFPFIPGLCGVK